VRAASRGNVGIVEMHNRLISFNLRLAVAMFLGAALMFLVAFVWAMLYLHP